MRWKWNGNGEEMCVWGEGGKEMGIVFQNYHNVCDVVMFLQVIYVEGVSVLIQSDPICSIGVKCVKIFKTEKT